MMPLNASNNAAHLEDEMAFRQRRYVPDIAMVVAKTKPRLAAAYRVVTDAAQRTRQVSTQ
jgi:hypothetical protein